MAKETKAKMSEDTVEAAKKVLEFKLACEANIVSIFYKDSQKIFDYNLEVSDFSNNTWRVYYQIAYDLAVKESKPVLDEVTVGLYLEKHEKLKAKYDEYGGYDTLINAMEYVRIDNLDGYVKDLHKWNTVLKMIKNEKPIKDRLSEFADMNLDEIYDEQEAMLNHIFINAEEDVKSYSIDDNLDELIAELDQGLRVGLPYHEQALINKETGGMLCGNITLVGALSNVGKSSFVRNTVLPSILEHDEKIAILLNEESHKRWQQELLVWCANTVFNYDLQKYIVRDGKFSPETKAILYKCAEWVRDRAGNHQITLIPLSSYTSAKAIKIIKKYSSLGVKYFVIDTLKADSGDTSGDIWFKMQQSMVEIYNIVKESAKNVHLLCTFQLGKSSSKLRYYTQDCISTFKNIVDVASTCIMIRNVMEDEYEGEKSAIQCYKLEGKSGKTKIPVKLKSDRHYQLVFIVKNRDGAANKYQIVCESDLSRNVIKEVGITNILPDW